MTRFGKYPDKHLPDISWPAVKQALADAGVELKDVQVANCGSGVGGMIVAQCILARIGRGVERVRRRVQTARRI